MVLRVLGDIRRGEEERREAAGVLAQILSPWIDGNTNIQEIDSALSDIVISLKGWLEVMKVLVVGVVVVGQLFLSSELCRVVYFYPADTAST